VKDYDPPRQQSVSRREMLLLSIAGLLVSPRLHPEPARADTAPMLEHRLIPSSKESLAVIGCGTYQTFDVGSSAAEHEPLLGVLSTLFAAGGSVIDTSPMYGNSEKVIGSLLNEQKSRPSAFLATKVWTSGAESGREQLRRSFELLKTDRIDLVQVHNLLDWRTHLPVLKTLKAQGRIRYVGVTHYTESAYDELEAVLKSQDLDFVQVNYSIDERAAAERILPLAHERGMAVLINRPFGGGGILRRLMPHPLPAWAAEIGCTSWAQILLKFVLGHPAVTCVIPGTGRPEYMRDNLAAGTGQMPDEAFRSRMLETIRAA
jgi:diketogulonate reductase-like aldo/keto reductase